MPACHSKSLVMTLLLRSAGHRDVQSIPVLALEAQTSYWTFVAVAPPRHMSFSGARSTGKHGWLPADRPVQPVYALDRVERHEGYRGYTGEVGALDPPRIGLRQDDGI